MRYVIVCLALLLGSSPNAQEFPRGPISLIVPLAAGDAADLTARALGDELSKLLKTAVVVHNRPASGGAVAIAGVVAAPKDGHTLLFTSNNGVTFRRILDPETAKYDPDRDLTPLGLAARTPAIITIGTNLPFKTLAEMADYSKRNPGKVRVGTPGLGSIGDFSVQIVNALTDAGLISVPFKGASPAISALQGAHVEGNAMALGAVASHLRAGTMRGVVISRKYAAHSDIPTLAELGYKQGLIGIWFGFFAPAGIPSEVNTALVSAIERAVKLPDLATKLQPLGIVLEHAGPRALAEEIREEYRQIETIAKRAGLVK